MAGWMGLMADMIRIKGRSFSPPRNWFSISDLESHKGCYKLHFKVEIQRSNGGHKLHWRYIACDIALLINKVIGIMKNIKSSIFSHTN